MKLYITDKSIKPLSGVSIRPEYMGLNLTHLMIASQVWKGAYVEISDAIPEGSLRFLPSKCETIKVRFEGKPSMHMMHLLIDLYPKLNGTIRKLYMKGDDMHELLLEMWWDRD